MIEDEEYAVGLTVYTHQSGTKEEDVRKRVGDRFRSFEATKAGLRKLDPRDTD